MCQTSALLKKIGFADWTLLINFNKKASHPDLPFLVSLLFSLFRSQIVSTFAATVFFIYHLRYALLPYYIMQHTVFIGT